MRSQLNTFTIRTKAGRLNGLLRLTWFDKMDGAAEGGYFEFMPDSRDRFYETEFLEPERIRRAIKNRGVQLVAPTKVIVAEWTEADSLSMTVWLDSIMLGL